jgi:Leucine-rich repeat (LRR) protein
MPSQIQVAAGATQVFSLTPNPGGKLVAAVGCPGQVLGQRFITEPVSQACTLRAIFIVDPGAVSAGILDPALREAVNRTLGLAAGTDPTRNDMARLTELDAPGAGIKQLNGIEAAVNLTRLVLRDNPIQQLPILAPLAKLEELNLAQTQVAQAFPLAALRQLKRLDLTQTPVTDLAPLPISSLNILRIEGTAVSNLATLQGQMEGGDTLYLGQSSLGCLLLRGYSRVQQQIQGLRNQGVVVISIDDGPRRSNCPAASSEIEATTQALFTPRGLELNWAVTGGDRNGLWRCELHTDMSLQANAEPLARIDSCAANASLIYNQPLASMQGLNLVMEDGLGGRFILPLKPNTSDKPGPVAAERIARIDLGQVVVAPFLRVVANKSLMVRAHLLSTQALPVPEGRMTISLPNGEKQTLPLKAPANLASSLAAEREDRPYVGEIPAPWVKEGMSLTLQVGSQTRTLVPEVGAANTLYVTLVPIKVDGLTTPIPDLAELKTQLLFGLPISDVQFRIREAITSEETDQYSILDAVDAQRAMDGEDSYYYGLVPSDTPDFTVGGVANFLGNSAIGLTDREVDQIMIHELGHVFGRAHVDCGNPDFVDPSYPYVGGKVPNMSLRNFMGVNYLIGTYAGFDIMSYCTPKRISDYFFNNTQAFLETNPPKPFNTPAKTAPGTLAQEAPRSIYIHGNKKDGRWQLAGFPSRQTPSQVRGEPSDFTLRVIDTQGQVHSQPLLWTVYGHGENTDGYFSASFAYVPAVRVEIWQGDTPVTGHDLQAP